MICSVVETMLYIESNAMQYLWNQILLDIFYHLLASASMRLMYVISMYSSFRKIMHVIVHLLLLIKVTEYTS